MRLDLVIGYQCFFSIPTIGTCDSQCVLSDKGRDVVTFSYQEGDLEFVLDKGRHKVSTDTGAAESCDIDMVDIGSSGCDCGLAADL